jgi:hypothetical protein
MVDHPVASKLNRLPRWAQDYIHDLRRERDEAVKALAEWEDEQTPSSFYVVSHVRDGEKVGAPARYRYINGGRVEFAAAGIEVAFIERRDGLDVLFGAASRTGPGQTAALFPKASNAVAIKAVEAPGE